MTSRTPDDRDMNTALRSWLHEGDEPTPDRGRQIGRIIGRVDETKQRRRLWPLSPFGRRVMHSATGDRESVVAPRGRTAALMPVRAMTAVALALLVASALGWIASRPPDVRSLPASWVVDPADEALFERFGTLWAGPETSLATTQEVYAEDAVHNVLWFDDAEVVRGDVGMWSRMYQSASADGTESPLIRLLDHYGGAHRYLLLAPVNGVDASDGTACVLWIEDERITRHDCILPMSIEGEERPLPLVPPDQSAIAEREVLTAALAEAQGPSRRAAQEQLISPDVTHHVLSTNQVYTLEGFDEYWAVMSRGRATPLTIVDLPAAEGEVRWANFNTVGSGSLCVFWARDGLITRHDCVVPGATTVSSTLTEIADPPAA